MYLSTGSYECGKAIIAGYLCVPRVSTSECLGKSPTLNGAGVE